MPDDSRGTDEDADVRGMIAVLDLLAARALPLKDQLMVLEMAWLTCAEDIRRNALIIPGGFPAEQDRQLGFLGHLIHLVSTATPDLELERLRLEGDADGLAEHLRRVRENETRPSTNPPS